MKRKKIFKKMDKIEEAILIAGLISMLFSLVQGIVIVVLHPEAFLDVVAQATLEPVLYAEAKWSLIIGAGLLVAAVGAIYYQGKLEKSLREFQAYKKSQVN